MKINFRWEKTRSGGERLYINKYWIGSCRYNDFRAKGEGDAKLYRGILTLSETTFYYASTPEEVKSHIEVAATAWFKEALREK